MIPTTLTSAFMLASEHITPKTVPAPHISHFISSMPELGLIEIPPVSKVIPFPTRAIGFSPFLPPLYSIIIILGGSSLPLDTLKYDPILSFAKSFSFKAFTFKLG